MVATKVTAQFALDYVKTVGITNNGASGRGFANPYDIAISRDGRIFVLNRCDPSRAEAVRISVCNLEEEHLAEFSNGYGSGDGQFIWPVAMAFDGDERLHITDEYNHRVCVYDSSGEYLFMWGAHGAGDGEIDGPAGIAFDSQNNAYVADQNNGRVQKFTSEGDFIGSFGEPGSDTGRLNLPWGVTVDSDDNVYVADWRNDRIQKFTPDGVFVAAFGGSGDGQFYRPSQVAIDGDGRIYVADWGNERVQVLDSDGKFLTKLRGQATVSAWAEEFLASNPDEKTERDRSNLTPALPPHLSTPYHVSSQTEPYFWGPVAVTLDGHGRLYVLESNRHRFQVYLKR